MAATVDTVRAQHGALCDKIIARLETKSSRGEGPSRVLRKILKHFDTSDSLMLSEGELVSAMDRIGTRLTPDDIQLLMTLYTPEGGAHFDGNRFTEDLFGEFGRSSASITDSTIQGGVFTRDSTPRNTMEDPAAVSTIDVNKDQAIRTRRSNDPSVEGGIFSMHPSDKVDGPRRPVSKTNMSSIPGGT